MSRQKETAAAPALNYEAKLWQMADALRNNMDAAECKHVVLGLIFLKYISDAFESKHAELEAQRASGADPEDPDEYRASSIFWVPMEARWQHLKANAPQPTTGTLVDDAMAAIERDNPSLKGVLPRDFGRVGLDKQRLGQIINLVSEIALGSAADRAKDTLGRVYEYFLARFASAEGKSGGQFHTPSHVARVLVEMLAPYKCRVYDPCCGSGGMFVSSEKSIEARAGKIGDISIYGQESNYTTWRLAKMNLAIRGIDSGIALGGAFRGVGSETHTRRFDFRGEALAPDAPKLGRVVDRTRRKQADADTPRIATLPRSPLGLCHGQDHYRIERASISPRHIARRVTSSWVRARGRRCETLEIQR